MYALKDSLVVFFAKLYRQVHMLESWIENTICLLFERQKSKYFFFISILLMFVCKIINLQVGQKFTFKYGIKIPLEEMNCMDMVSVMCPQRQACMKLNAQPGGPLGVSRNKCHSIFWEEDRNWKTPTWYTVVLTVTDFIPLLWEMFMYGLESYSGTLTNMELNVNTCSDIFHLNFFIDLNNMKFNIRLRDVSNI